MGFRQYAPPTNLPDEIRNVIADLESKSQNQLEFVEAVYNFVLTRWQHSRGKAAIMIPRLFKKDLVEIWNTKGFIYCHTMNFIVNTLLANSKYFKASDVKVRHIFLNFVPHQYLQVNIGGKWTYVDPAGAGIRGLPVGNRMSLIG
jgi:hypothetical protein